MGTTADKLAKLAETKEAIRIAINDKGVEVSEAESFASYPEKIASIESGGGTIQFSLNLTLDGGDASRLEGATIIVTDLNSGIVLDLVYNPAGLSFSIDKGSNFKIICKRSGVYSPPAPYTSVAGNGVETNITLNYITADLGVFIYTSDDRLVPINSYAEPASNIVGIYLGTADYKFVIGEALVSQCNYSPWWGSYQSSGINVNWTYYDNTDAILTKGSGAMWANFNLAKSYTFNGVSGSVPPDGYATIILLNMDAVNAGYKAWGKTNMLSNSAYIQTSSVRNFGTYDGAFAIDAGGNITREACTYVIPYINFEKIPQL